MAMQMNLFGECASSPPTKRRHVQGEVYRDSWKEAAPWPCAAGVELQDLPTTWLKPVGESSEVSGMLCTSCRRYDKVPRSGKATWNKEPCTLMRLQSVRCHAKSSMHEDAVHLKINRQYSCKDAASFQHSWEVQEKAICAAMSCVYFLAKEEIPHMTKYKPLLEFIGHLGLPFLETLHKAENAKSTSHCIIEVFLSLLGEAVTASLIGDLQKSPCFAIICDETTDLSTTKQLIIYTSTKTF